MSQLLDDNFQQKPSSEPRVPRVWYIYHAGMIMGLFGGIFLIIFGILPLLPQFIEKVVEEILLPILIFGIYGITFYAYYKGFKWDGLVAFFGASFSFFFCFIFTMTNKELIGEYALPILKFFTVDNDFAEIMPIGFVYSILVFPCTELILVIKGIYERFSKR